MNSLGKKIRDLRHKQGFTLDELARKSSVSKAYLSQLENEESGRPSAEMLYNIAIALGTSIAALLGKQVLTEKGGAPEIPRNLQKASLEYKIPKEYVERLARISMREGQKPEDYSPEDWFSLYATIRRHKSK